MFDSSHSPRPGRDLAVQECCGPDEGEDTNLLDRRSMLRLAGGAALGAGALGVPLATAPAIAGTTQQPVSMAMHIHSSFSEGSASMDAHLDQARQLGVDVVWWTDHDFRQSAFGYRRAVEFDAASEPENHWDLSWFGLRSGSLASADNSFVSSPNSTGGSGGGSMRVTAKAEGTSWASYLMEARAANLMYSTSYADTTLSLDVCPEQANYNTQILVEIESSYRPASGGRPAGVYRIQYRVGGAEGYSRENGGLLGVVGIRAGQTGVFQRLTLDLRRDHAQLWPDTVADDASLCRLRVGVRARSGATSTANFDRLRFYRTRSTPADGRALAHRAVEQYRSRYPGVKQFSASEISLVLHLNAFGGDGTLPTYAGSSVVKNTSVQAQLDMVAFLKKHGSTVAINHPLQGSGGPRSLARRLVTHRGMGAHVIEIGTGTGVDKLAGVYDAAARNAVFLTANGSTDDHSGRDWLQPGRRWLTKVWSSTTRRQDLCDALEAGRAWFYDPLWWKGAFDLHVDGRTRMGGVHFTRKSTVQLTVTASDLPRHSAMEVVVGRCDLSGSISPDNRSIVVRRSEVSHGVWERGIRPHSGVYVRVMLRRGNGDVIGFSNPVWVLPDSRRDTVSVPRARR